MTFVTDVYIVLPFQANTEILVGVKAELGEPLPEKLDRGRLEFFVDWLVHLEGLALLISFSVWVIYLEKHVLEKWLIDNVLDL